MSKQKKQERIDPKDIHWKVLVAIFTEHFILFFLPDLYKLVDFSKPIELLDKELNNIIPEELKGQRFTDVLVKLHLLDGTECWILLYIEIQGYPDPNFGERMFIIYYRILDKFKKDVVALAVFTCKKRMPKQYVHKLLGTEIRFKYNTYRIFSQQGREEELEKSDNIFALAVLACLFAEQTRFKKMGRERLAAKLKLVRLMKEKGYDNQEIFCFIIFIKKLLSLSEDLELQFETQSQKMLKMGTQEYSEEMLAYSSDLYERMYGINPIKAQRREEEAQKRTEEIAKEKEEIAKEKEEIAKEKEEVVEKLVLTLYTNVGNTVEQISENLDMSENRVLHILKKHGLLK